MKKIFLSIAFLAGFVALKAQQDVQYTNFMFNRLPFNPAYAGSKEVASITALYRTQWVGFDGAPNSQSLNFHTPLWKDRIGLGVGLERDAITFFQNYRGSVAYAYRFPVGKKGKLSFGLQGTVRMLRADWTKAVDRNGMPVNTSDQAVMSNDKSKILPNFGAGVYYYNEKFYAGVGLPHLINSDIDFANPGNANTDVVAADRRHVFGNVGMIIPLGSKVKFTPNIMTKYVRNSPFDMDINASFLFVDKLSLGATYRLGDSADAVLHWLITPQLRLGLGYDFTLTELQKYNSGSYEVMLGYDFNYNKNEKVSNPRFYW